MKLRILNFHNVKDLIDIYNNLRDIPFWKLGFCCQANLGICRHWCPGKNEGVYGLANEIDTSSKNIHGAICANHLSCHMPYNCKKYAGTPWRWLILHHLYKFSAAKPFLQNSYTLSLSLKWRGHVWHCTIRYSAGHISKTRQQVPVQCTLLVMQ